MLRRSILLLCAASVLFAAKAPNPDLVRIKTVYLLPMGNGMDQYIANRLTREGPFRVVTDPSLADAVFTDRLGESFEIRFKELYPPPPPPPKEDEEKEAGEEKGAGQETIVVQEMSRVSTWGRAKGNFFLVDRESKKVVWSTYARPWTTRTDDLHRLANKVVNSLKSDAKTK